MKIAFLHMTMGLVDRGSERVIDQIATHLSINHKILVLQSGPTSKKRYSTKRIYDLKKPPEAAPRHIIEKALFRVGQDPRSRLVQGFTRACLTELSSFRPDIVVAVNGSHQVRIVKSALPNIKVVVFGHAGIGHDDRANVLARPDLFVALTEEAETWAKSIGSTKIVYIPNPIDLNIYKKTKPVALNLPKPVVLTVSALSAYKNILSVVEAIRSLNVSYVLIGDGEYGDEVMRQLSTLPNEFKWIKHVDPEEIAMYYKSADCFCFTPDPQEAFGMVYLEAMAAELPIVASDDPIRRSIIGEKGYYVDPHNSVEIAKKIVAAVQHTNINYREELNKYKLENVVNNIEKEFHALTN